jgi:hypothetical protein
MNWVFTDLVEKRRMKASLRSIRLAALRALIASWDTRYVMRETRHLINAEVAAAIMYLPE